MTICRLQKTVPSLSQVEITLWPAAVVAFPVLLLSVAHSTPLVKRLACSQHSPRVFYFSHLAAVAHKTLPVKGSAPDVAQVWYGTARGCYVAGAWGGCPFQEECSLGLYQPSCVTTGVNMHLQANEPAGRLSFGKAGTAIMDLPDLPKTQISIRTTAPNPVRSKHLSKLTHW